ncbi:MAG: hypothetical protein Q7S66_00900 [bacterium]|nr:hypothetical protein [bacterium]
MRLVVLLVLCFVCLAFIFQMISLRLRQKATRRVIILPEACRLTREITYVLLCEWGRLGNPPIDLANARETIATEQSEDDQFLLMGAYIKWYVTKLWDGLLKIEQFPRRGRNQCYPDLSHKLDRLGELRLEMGGAPSWEKKWWRERRREPRD